MHNEFKDIEIWGASVPLQMKYLVNTVAGLESNTRVMFSRPKCRTIFCNRKPFVLDNSCSTSSFHYVSKLSLYWTQPGHQLLGIGIPQGTMWLLSCQDLSVAQAVQDRWIIYYSWGRHVTCPMAPKMNHNIQREQTLDSTMIMQGHSCFVAPLINSISATCYNIAEHSTEHKGFKANATNQLAQNVPICFLEIGESMVALRLFCIQPSQKVLGMMQDGSI